MESGVKMALPKNRVRPRWWTTNQGLGKESSSMMLFYFWRVPFAAFGRHSAQPAESGLVRRQHHVVPRTAALRHRPDAQRRLVAGASEARPHHALPPARQDLCENRQNPVVAGTPTPAMEDIVFDFIGRFGTRRGTSIGTPALASSRASSSRCASVPTSSTSSTCALWSTPAR